MARAGCYHYLGQRDSRRVCMANCLGNHRMVRGSDHHLGQLLDSLMVWPSAGRTDG